MDFGGERAVVNGSDLSWVPEAVQLPIPSARMQPGLLPGGPGARTGRAAASAGREAGRLRPDDVIECVALRGTMTARTCVARQEARFRPHGGVVFVPCGSGDCAQGKLVKLSLPEDYRSRPYQEYRNGPEQRAQRKARARWYAEKASEEPTLERPPVAPRFQRDLDHVGESAPGSGKPVRDNRGVKTVTQTTQNSAQKMCAGCGKALRPPNGHRAGSVGDHCYRCRLSRGEAIPSRPRARPIPPPQGLPEPSSLPAAYLRSCVDAWLELCRGAEQLLRAQTR